MLNTWANLTTLCGCIQVAEWSWRKTHNHNDWLHFMTTDHRRTVSTARESYYDLASYSPEEIEVVEDNFHMCPWRILQITCIHILCIPFFHNQWTIWGCILSWALDLTLSCQRFWSKSDLFLCLINIPLCTEPLSIAYKYSIFHEEKPCSLRSSQATASLLFPLIAKPLLIESIVSSHCLHFISLTFRSTFCRYHTTERALVKVTPNC